jgi:hypothetical protein
MKSNPRQPLDYANDLKAAATDALKKCASEIGIANDIYGKNEFREISSETPTPKAKQAKAQPKAEPVKTEVDYLAKLKTELQKRGAHSEPEAVAIYNKISGLNIKSLKVNQNTAKKLLFNLLNNSPMAQ